jgi:bacillithiol biosynthesis deacetylase BshB1
MKLHILAIAIHPDDIELSAAGTLIKHARMGQPVGVLDLSAGELGTRGSAEIRLKEAQDAAQIMGLAVREYAGMADGFFRNDEEHQRKLITYIRRHQPDIVIANALADRHPDHGRAGRLIADACFLAGLRRIESSDSEGKAQEAWRPKRIFHMIQDRFAEPGFIVDITESFEAKIESMKAYKSQFHDPNSDEPMTYIASLDFFEAIKARALLLGKRIGVKYGEGFICENVPGVSDLDKLVYPEIS